MNPPHILETTPPYTHRALTRAGGMCVENGGMGLGNDWNEELMMFTQRQRFDAYSEAGTNTHRLCTSGSVGKVYLHANTWHWRCRATDR